MNQHDEMAAGEDVETSQQQQDSSSESADSVIVGQPVQPISSISLRMVSDCINVVLDQTHFQLSSVINISKTNNELNIEHNIVENSSDYSPGTSNRIECNIGGGGNASIGGSLSQTPKQSQYRTDPMMQMRFSDQQKMKKKSKDKHRMPPPYSLQGPPFLLKFQDCQVPKPPLHGAPPTYSAVMHINGAAATAAITAITEQPMRNSLHSYNNTTAPTPSRIINAILASTGSANMVSSSSGCRRNLGNSGVCIQPSPPFIALATRPPPPSYAEAQGLVHEERTIELAENVAWGMDPVTVVCPNCGGIVVTHVYYQRSNLTHFSALALCICGCWPCCLLPYCMKACKTSYHECPNCRHVIGMYSP